MPDTTDLIILATILAIVLLVIRYRVFGGLGGAHPYNDLPPSGNFDNASPTADDDASESASCDDGGSCDSGDSGGGGD